MRMPTHPFRLHGNHVRIIAADGRMLESAPGAGPDLSTSVFTVQSFPGGMVTLIIVEAMNTPIDEQGGGKNDDIENTI